MRRFSSYSCTLILTSLRLNKIYKCALVPPLLSGRTLWLVYRRSFLLARTVRQNQKKKGGPFRRSSSFFFDPNTDPNHSSTYSLQHPRRYKTPVA